MAGQENKVETLGLDNINIQDDMEGRTILSPALLQQAVDRKEIYACQASGGHLGTHIYHLSL